MSGTTTAFNLLPPTAQSYTMTETSPQANSSFNVTGVSLQPASSTITSTELHASLAPQPIDLTGLSRKIINLVMNDIESSRHTKEGRFDLVKRVLSHAVDGKTTNDEIAEQLGLTSEERALIMNLKSDAKAGSITNSATGEVYISRSDFKLAMLRNIGKINFHNTVSPFINLIAKAFSGGEPDFDNIIEQVMTGNLQYFEAIFKDLIGKHLTSTDTFSSLARKAIAALERGIDKTLAELQVSQPLKEPTPNQATIVSKALVA